MLHRIKQLAPLIIIVLLMLSIQNWWRVELILNPINADAISSSEVILYSTSWCPYCRKARKFLQEANIPFTEYDIEKSTRAYAEYQQINGRGVPVLLIGSQVVQGYNPSAIRSAIATLPQTP